MKLESIDNLDFGYHGENAIHRTEDGCELYYELEGEGPCITFISMIYVVSTAWRNFDRELVKKNKILTYDLRNQGASLGEPRGFDQHADDLRSLLDALDIDRTYLVGSSISTLICRDFAVRHPDRVAGLILVGPPISPWGSKRRPRIAKSWLTTLESGGPRALLDTLYPLVFGDRAQAEGGTATYLALRERFLAVNSASQLRENIQDAMAASDDVELLRRIDAPTLLMSGDDDFCTSRSALRAIADLIPDARIEVFDDCGHLPFFERTEHFERSVRGFIDSVEAKRPTN